MNKKDELIVGIADLFFEKGYDKTSIRDISSTLNISKPGLYFHFENKQQMLYDIVYDFLHRSNEYLKEAMNPIQDPKEKLLLIIESHILFSVQYRSQAKVMIYEAHSLEGDFATEFLKLQEEYIDIIRGVFKELIKGKKTTLDLNVAIFTLLGTLNWILKWYKPEKKIKPEKLVKQVHQFFLKGLNID